MGDDQGAALQPRGAVVAAGAAGAPDPLHRARRRRRVRHSRRVLSGGLPDPLRRHEAGAAGEVDRGPARAPDGRQPLAGCALRAGDRRAPGRHAAGHARPDPRRHGRAHPHPRRAGAGVHRRRAARAVPYPGLRGPHTLRHDQQDGGGHLPRARALRVVLFPRADARHGGRGPGHRPHRPAPQEPDPARGDPLRAGTHPSGHRLHHLRQRRLSHGRWSTPWNGSATTS